MVGARPRQRPTRKAMLSGRFYVFGEAEELRPPVDWVADPHGSRSWRYELQALTWLKEALERHARGGDVETLAAARDVALDWARAHVGPEAAPEGEQSEFAWYDMAVGLRAPYLAYVLRACVDGDALDGEDVALLREAVERHGAELADGGNYAAGNNHGLFQDEGLYLLARLLPELPSAAAWRELALVRMRATLGETVGFVEGAHLEHSPAYQLAIVDLVARLAANVSELPELGELLDRMRRTAAWQTTPGGRMAQLGDTDDLPAPEWARDTARILRGMRALPEAGQVFVREDDSYLAVGAAYHGAAHKHADDTGFVLIENGETLLGDAGRWGYYEDEPDRVYARSAAAHNVLTVDGRDFDWRDARPYGSGLVAADVERGWRRIAVRNPLLARQGVDHLRLILYRPAETLVVLDDVRSPEEHEYARHFHLGPTLETERQGADSIAVTGKGVAATLKSLGEGVEVDLTRGREDPRLGWTYPGDRERKAVWAVRLRSRARSATLVAALTLSGKALTSRSAPVVHGLRRLRELRD